MPQQVEITGETSLPVFDEDNIWASAAVHRSVPTTDANIDFIWNKEIDEFKKAMRKVRRKITHDDGEITWEFNGGVGRVQDIDVLQFYAEHYELFPLFACVVRKILGTNAASTLCERTFNYAGIVLNGRRTSLLTDMADKLIVSACRHKNVLRSELKSPMLPNIGEIEIVSTIAEETAEETAEESEAAEECWDDFLVNCSSFCYIKMMIWL
jgi:hypothetical protein